MMLPSAKMADGSHLQRPTLLAKIFGCFKITFRKTHNHGDPSKAKVTQMNLLVMENLFYDRRFSKVMSATASQCPLTATRHGIDLRSQGLYPQSTRTIDWTGERGFAG